MNLPLNVSREILQQNRQVERIKGAGTKTRARSARQVAKDEADKYTTFWDAFGGVLKEGIAEDASNRERIAKRCALPRRIRRLGTDRFAG